jgi:large subunit ribosomal protein L13
MKTYSAKPTEVVRRWHLLDASEISLGRLSTVAARLLIGKDKPMVTSHVDTGDYVIVINSDHLRVTGDKMNKKIYYRHTHFPGGLKETPLKDQMTKDSTKVIEHAVRGMLPVNKLRDGRLARLKVYAGAEHNHAAQQPTKFELTKKGGR